MKLLNRFELIVDKKRYTDQGLKKGDKRIVLGKERNGYWLVYFDGEIFKVQTVFGKPQKSMRQF
ncbi:MAG: hypothetical protein SPG87_00190 [Eubacteriales bacterium]|nr:hypothetical protein [Eubacteriales bacterium]